MCMRCDALHRLVISHSTQVTVTSAPHSMPDMHRPVSRVELVEILALRTQAPPADNKHLALQDGPLSTAQHDTSLPCTQPHAC